MPPRAPTTPTPPAATAGHLFTVTPHTEGFIPAKYIRTGDSTTGVAVAEKVPHNYLIGFNGHYVEATGTSRIPNAMGGVSLASLPLVGADTLKKDYEGNDLTPQPVQGKGLTVGDYTFAANAYGLSTATTNALNGHRDNGTGAVGEALLADDARAAFADSAPPTTRSS